MKEKQVRESFPTKNETSAKEVLELVHTGSCGLRKQSISGKIYFITFIDDYSRKVFVKFPEKKIEYLQAFKDFKKSVEFETGRKIKMIRQIMLKN